MAHSWKEDAIPPPPPKDGRLQGLRNRLSLVLDPALGVPLRLIGVAWLCLGVGSTLLALSAAEPEAPPAPARSDLDPSPSPPAPPPPAMRLAVAMSPNSLIEPLSTIGLIVPKMPRPDPAIVCDLLALGGDAGRWVPGPVFDGEWECLSSKRTTVSASAGSSETVPGKAKGTSDAITLFTIARGSRESLVSTIRWKISAPDEASASAGAAELAGSVTALFEAMRWPLPERIPLSMRLLQPFEIKEGGMQIRFVKERMAEGHYNLILTFPSEKTRILNDDLRDLAGFFRETNVL